MFVWLRRQRLSRKLLIIGILAIAMTAFPTGLYVHSALTQLRAAEREAQGMSPLAAVNVIIQFVQKHRGLASATLNGDASFEEERHAVRDSVNAGFDQIQTHIQTASAPTQQTLADIRQEWVTLEGNVSAVGLAPHESLEGHSVLVRDLLILSDTILNEYGLNITTHRDVQALVSSTMQQTPMLSELFGLLRAKGVGYLSQRYLSVEGRATMRNLFDQARQLQASNERALRRAMELNPEFHAALEGYTEYVNGQIQAASDAVYKGLVDAPPMLRMPVAEYLETMTQTVDAIHALNAAGADQLEQHLRKRASDTRRNIFIIVGAQVVFVLIFLVLRVVFTHSITGPVSHAVDLANDVASGDLGGWDDITDPNEVGELMKTLQKMRNQLRRIVSRVRTAADSMAEASAQIATGNQDLSVRTRTQAAALEQTAAAMEQLGVTVRLNADHAQETSRLTQAAREVVNEGGALVQQMVQTMRGIDESSRKIADIIEVIDGIAFQTNLLALNASVEAVRAGEQGRGFAVVAGEVRNLAGRSATAAKEIKALIETTVSRISEGNRLAQRAGSTMYEVVESIEKVNSLANTISRASQEQATGVTQVGEAITKMDQATDKNADLVQQMATSAQTLFAHSQELVKAVSVFRWSGTEALKTYTLPGTEEPVEDIQPAVVKRTRKPRKPRRNIATGPLPAEVSMHKGAAAPTANAAARSPSLPAPSASREAGKA